MQALTRELQSIVSRMAALGPSPRQGGRRRRNRRRGAQVGNTAAVTQPSLQASTSAPGRRRRRPRQAFGTKCAADGSFAIRKQELVTSIVIEKGTTQKKGHIDLVPDSFPFLKTIFKSFERIRWEAVTFWYNPLVGTTYGGAITMGFDQDWTKGDVDRPKVSALSPNHTVQLYGSGANRKLRLTRANLTTRLQYIPRASDWDDKGPGKLVWAVDGTSSQSDTTVGEIWVDYTACLSGTCSSE